MGPFVIREYQPGQRVLFDRNPRYFRTAEDGSALPYLDRLVLQVVPDQDAELMRLQSGEIDLGSSALRVEDYVPVRRLEEQGRLRLIELGVDAGADAFWFCLAPEVKQADPTLRFRPAPRVPSGDFARGRSRGVRGNRVPRRGRAGLGPGHAGQQRVVLAGSSALRAKRRSRAGAVEGHRSRGSQRQRRRGGRQRHRSAVHRRDRAWRRVVRARVGRAAARARTNRHCARDCGARVQ